MSKNKPNKNKKVEQQLKYQNILLEARNKTNISSLFVPFAKYKGNDNNEYSFEVKRRDEMSEDEIQKCFDILKTNMKSFYEDSTWGWNDKKKMQELKNEDARYILVKFEEELCGFIHFRFLYEDDKLLVYIYEIQLSEKYRRKNLGNRLMKYLTLITIKFNFQDIRLTVFKANNSAKCFYEHLGFKIDETSPENTLDEEFDYIIMSKCINPNPIK